MDHYKFYQNTECEFFPCHNIRNTEDFNCLFCFCPLYAVKNCGGKFSYLENGIKDCSKCVLPHLRDGHDFVMSHVEDILELGKKTRD